MYANGSIKTTDTTYLKINKKVVKKGTLLETKKTGSDGKLTFNTKLYPGSYYIQEITPPKGYLPNLEKKTFTLNQHQKEVKKTLSYTADSNEQEISGRISITKTKGPKKIAEAGVSFDIITLQNIEINKKTYKTNSVVQTITTDKDRCGQERSSGCGTVWIRGDFQSLCGNGLKEL